MEYLTENIQKQPENCIKGVQNVDTLYAENIQTWAFGDTLVRTVQIKKTPWFVAKDVAIALDYQTAIKMTRSLDYDEVASCAISTSGGVQKMLVTNESGLYHAIFMSRKESAEKFRRWVTSEVLPALRKDGVYSTSVDTELELEKKRAKIARLKASRYVLEHIEDLHKDGFLSQSVVKKILSIQTNIAAYGVRANDRPVFSQKMKEWFPRLVKTPGGYSRLSDLRNSFCSFCGKEITQTLFTRLLHEQNPDIAITQRKLDGGNFPIQIIAGYTLNQME